MHLYYIKLAFRSIWNNRRFSIINVLGLAVGIACFLLVGGYIWQEWRVNKDLRNLDRQYIIQSKWKNPNMGIPYTTAGYLTRALKEHYAHFVANYYRFDGITSNVSKGEKVFREGLQIGDSTLLKMYGFPLKYGDEDTALDAPFSLVLTTEKAIKYFGKENVLGESLAIENFSGEVRNFNITGVLEKNRQNTITTFSPNNDNHFFIPSNSLSFFGRSIDTWHNIYTLSFLELPEGVSPADLSMPMQKLVQENAPTHIAENLEPYLVPLKTYHLNVGDGSVKKMIYTLFIIALFILLMAIINFVNIAISRANTRIKEIGIRKTLGSRRSSLMVQFYVEAWILVSSAAVFALIIYALVHPIASSFLSNEVTSLLNYPWYFVLFLFALIGTITLLVGTYPALIISSFQAVQSMKGQLTKVKNHALLRKSLLVFQFFVAMVVLIVANIINQQVQYFFNKDLGYDKDLVISAAVSRDWTAEGVARMDNFRKQLAALPVVQEASLSYSIPDGNTAGQEALYKLGSDSTNVVAAESIMIDAYYTKTYNIPLAAGQLYTPNAPQQSTHELLINEAASKALGWENPSDAVRQHLRLVSNSTPFVIKGVLKNYHYGSLHQEIQAAIFPNVHSTNLYRFFSLKLDTKNVQASLTAIRHKWTELMPNTPFDYQFQDEALAALYIREFRLQKAAYAATILSIIIVLLGVFGMLTLSIQKRRREIGVRKIIGANTIHIIALFLKDFIAVLLFAAISAGLLAWYFSRIWLEAYSYRIPITILPFLSAFILLVSVSISLIVLQCLKASRMNPVDAIRQV
ncbi:MAG: FtsX-like permease family protein [Bacteroidota bacterium]